MVETTDMGKDLYMEEIICKGVLVSIQAQVKDSKGTGRVGSKGLMRVSQKNKALVSLLYCAVHEAYVLNIRSIWKICVPIWNHDNKELCLANGAPSHYCIYFLVLLIASQVIALTYSS